MSTFCQSSYHRKCQPRVVGGQKKQNLVNVVCERPLSHLLLITELKQNIKNKAISGIQFEQKVRIYSHEDFFQRNIFSNHSIVALIDSTTVKGSIWFEAFASLSFLKPIFTEVVTSKSKSSTSFYKCNLCSNSIKWSCLQNSRLYC